MKVGAIIQARMGSTRLPGKVLKQVLGKTLLEFQIERVKRAETIDCIIVATTNNQLDDAIVDLCQQLSIPCFRGSEDDVLCRYYKASQQHHIDVVVRLTSDCPLICPDVIDKTIHTFLANQEDCDYVSNTLIRTFPRGLDTEVFSFKTLKKVFESSVEKADREHVTSYIYRNPEIFHLKNVASGQELGNFRWTVDTMEDFILIQKIIEALYPVNQYFTMMDVLDLIQKNPKWQKINSHIEQKKLSETGGKMTVTLRKIEKSDLEMIMNWRMTPEVTKYMYTDPYLTIADQDRWFEKIMKNSLVEKYWIILIGNRIPVGLMSLNHIDPKNQQASWAYYIASTEARGKGLGRMLECNMYDYVFHTLKLNKLWCEVLESNEKVINIHKKFGSKVEGRLIQHIFKNGEFLNVVRMAILRSEWENLKENIEYTKITIETY